MKICISATADLQKMGKTTFRLQAMSRKHRKEPVAHGFSSENGENSISLTSNERKAQKNVLRGIPKGRNSEKQCFGMPRRVVFCENEPSGSPEASKFQKTSFRGAPKREKSEKYAFGESRSSKNLKSSSSGRPET